ncbi:MAG: ABC transporter permease [Bacilli bacterium]|nr:ABC transporter permease [Bacilli bacterium]
MNFFRRSYTSIIRRKGKSLILFLAILLISNVIAGSISVKKALANTEKSITEKMPVEIKIELDYEKITDKEPEKLTEKQINQIGKSTYIKDYYYSYNYNLQSTTLKLVNENILFRTSSLEDKISIIGQENSFSIIGSNSTIIREITLDKFNIIDGKTYTKDDIEKGNNVVIISKELAKKNNLKVGSTITLGKNIEDYSGVDFKILKSIKEEYKVIGIFEAKTNLIKDEDGKIVEEYNPLVDYIYMPNKTMEFIHNKIITSYDELNIEDYDSFDIKATFNLKNINELDDFKNENIKKLLTGYKFTDNSELYNKTIGPMQNMQSLSNFIMYASIIASIIIIGLITVLFFRERKHEIGIYLALGEYKMNIAIQVLLETIIISLLAVSISIFSGNLLAKNISNKMLDNEISSSSKEDNISYDEFGYQNNIDKKEIMSKYSVSLDINTIFIIYIVCLGSVTLSTLLPIYYTLKINPRKILM